MSDLRATERRKLEASMKALGRVPTVTAIEAMRRYTESMKLVSWPASEIARRWRRRV